MNTKRGYKTQTTLFVNDACTDTRANHFFRYNWRLREYLAGHENFSFDKVFLQQELISCTYFPQRKPFDNDQQRETTLGLLAERPHGDFGRPWQYWLWLKMLHFCMNNDCGGLRSQCLVRPRTLDIWTNPKIPLTAAEILMETMGSYIYAHAKTQSWCASNHILHIGY